MKQLTPYVFGAIALFASCKGTNKIMEIRELPELEVTAPRNLEEDKATLPKYQATATRTFDLKHTALDVRFDWDKQYLLGKATLTLSPYFYKSDMVELDAKGFDINYIRQIKNDLQIPLKYDYDGMKLKIKLDGMYERSQTVVLEIDYVAKPNELEEGGSAAITSDKGLYFINPKNEEPNKPQQIWTQGETEASSCWFPTIDKPNERCTQEIKITVNKRFNTLSNGLLKSSKANIDGTRTDYWVMDKPHAPYLFMMAIGEFAVVKDKWKDLELEYYVEKDYEPYAKNIFSNTPEMMTFYSDLLGVEYPWQKYSQVIVRDYVSGAMENTTGVIFGEFVQKTDRELIDNHNERIVAHELIHHWFGDLVTCESWSNLPLNESFANYGEYLWFEHKYGREEADYHRMGELNGYLGQARRSVHPLIYFGYESREDMFDAHSYNKGGSILHMLRTQIGDAAFFEALNRYLKDNEYTAVESHQLRLAFEAVTGQDMNGFFNQWFFKAGHPQLDIDYVYNDSLKQTAVTIKQTQTGKEVPRIFELPLAIDIYNGKQVSRHDIVVNSRTQTFTFATDRKPNLVNVDATKTLVGEKNDNHTTDEWVFQYMNAPLFLDRYEALVALKKVKKTKEVEGVFAEALQDDFWVLRGRAIQSVKVEKGSDIAKVIADMATNDPHSNVRAAAIEKLSEIGDKQYVTLVKKAIDSDKAYPVVSSGLQALNVLDSKAALKYAETMKSEENGTILAAISSIYLKSNSLKYLPFFENNWNKVEGYGAISFISNYADLLVSGDETVIMEGAEKLLVVATNLQGSPWNRYAATNSINRFRSHLRTEANKAEGEAMKSKLEGKVSELGKMIEKIKSVETNSQLKNMYNGF